MPSAPAGILRLCNSALVGRLIRAGMNDANYLHAIVHDKYSNSDKLRAWKSASHIRRARQREKNRLTVCLS